MPKNSLNVSVLPGARREECATTPERDLACTGLKSAGLKSQVQLHNVIIPTSFERLYEVRLCAVRNAWKRAPTSECRISSRHEGSALLGENSTENGVTGEEPCRSQVYTWR